MTDFRALCAELLDEIPHESPTTCLARAALAEPQGEEPTDEEIMALMPQKMHDDLAAAARSMVDQAGTDSRRAMGMIRIILNRHVVDLARAVLARWGRPAPPPADDGPAVQSREPASCVQQATAEEPVPVWWAPGSDVCDAKGRCWIHQPDRGNSPSWRLVDPRAIGPLHTHWLPAHALPLPTTTETTDD